MAAKNVKKLRDVRAAFMAQVDKSGACWEWTGRKDPDGYGQFSGSGLKSIKAYRLSYEMFIGPIPEGMCICHDCDNKSCVKPSHLFCGTHSDNVYDHYRKKRHYMHVTNLSEAISMDGGLKNFIDRILPEKRREIDFWRRGFNGNQLLTGIVSGFFYMGCHEDLAKIGIWTEFPDPKDKRRDFWLYKKTFSDLKASRESGRRPAE